MLLHLSEVFFHTVGITAGTKILAGSGSDHEKIINIHYDVIANTVGRIGNPLWQPVKHYRLKTSQRLKNA